MIFSSFQYVAFFLVVVFLVWIARRSFYQKLILIAASYVFYAFWDYRFLLMIFSLSAFNYIAGRMIERSDIQAARVRWLTASVIFNLGILGFFKYYNFCIGTADFFLARLDLHLPFLNIILPVGISFMVFEVMSYTIDIYRGDTPSADSFWDLVLLVAFFPHLIAGPILKPQQFLPQMRKDLVLTWANFEAGLTMFLLGLIKKVLIANSVAPFVDYVFKSPEPYSGATLWIAVMCYGIQIYADFSGYSDMAIGSAKVMGYDIPRNFNFPYVSKNITEFWRRWHISLSTWLREYLYFSLGGNRIGTVRQYVNLMIVMLLGGLWHGASWNFVVWGGMHGIGLAVHKAFAATVKPWYAKQPPAVMALSRAVSWFATIVFVHVTWVFFRASDFHTSFYMVRKMFGVIDPSGITWPTVQFAVILPIFVVSHWVGSRLKGYPLIPLNRFAGQFILFLLLGLLYAFAPTSSSPFIYFQF